jgi:CBS domain-containing protein
MALSYYSPTKNKKRRVFMGLLRIARTPLVAIGAEVTVNEAVRTMAQASIGAIGVTDRNRLIGIFSERDLMLRVVLEKRDPQRTHIRDVMTSPVSTIHRDSTADEALKVMVEKHIRHLPIIDRDGTLCGMISMRNLLHNKVEELTDQLDSLEAYFTADGSGG